MSKRKTSEKRKEEVFEATLEIIYEEGKKNLTIRRIAEKIGISESAIYRHFKNKKDILRQLVEKVLEQGKEDFKEERFEGLKEHLEFAIKSNFSMLEENPHLAAFLFHEDLFAEHPELMEKFQEYREEKMERIKDLVKKAQERGEVSEEVDPKTFSEIFIGSIYISIIEWRRKEFSYSLEEKAEEIINELSKILEK